MANNQIVWCISELTNIKEFPDKYPITKESILSFVDILVSNAKARTGIGEKRIKEYNQLFYEHLAFYFRTENSILDVNGDEFKKLCSMFKVPVIKNDLRSEKEMLPGEDKIPKIRHTGNIMDSPKGGMNMELIKNRSVEEKKILSHKDCLEMFNHLSTEEKIKFIMEFQNIEIKLTPNEILVFKSC